MSDNDSNDDPQAAAAADARTRAAGRPLGVGLAIVVVVAAAAGVLSATAPDAFATVGGWVTAIVLMVLTVALVSTLMVLRINQHNR
ncbi:hypothetical protein ACH436_10090 [Isoptericola sp. NPDC019693]|uniref:hypothetical protein n=1 Tax=Isoptericola sp. NPDC019693 TaxID=3364009 RepID=UPI00378F11E2